MGFEKSLTVSNGISNNSVEHGLTRLRELQNDDSVSSNLLVLVGDGIADGFAANIGTV